jgi:NAD(P)-dependent dehydrogenase (short-subunit alcohol dehydrogenase family)
MRFSEKVALVAGGTGGLARAVSLVFLNEGAKVVVTFRNQEELVALTIIDESDLSRNRLSSSMRQTSDVHIGS